jgi:Tfp pilus assembly protein PilP
MLKIKLNPAGVLTLSLLLGGLLTQVGCGNKPSGQTAVNVAPAAPGKPAKEIVLPSSTDTLLKSESYQYELKHQRDPFKSMVQKRGEGSGENTVGTLDISNITLTGIIEGPSGRLGLVHDNQGVGYVIQEGDQLIGGRVAAIKDTNVIFRQEVEKGKFIDFSIPIFKSESELRLKP